MAIRRKLSTLVAEIHEAIEGQFADDYYWIVAEITDVKKYPSKGWCFLKFIEKRGDIIDTEIKGVFWANRYAAISGFEQLTQQSFADGLEVTCCVKVKFHKRYGLTLEVIDIDANYTIGKVELERQATLKKLLDENASFIKFYNEQFVTHNNTCELPLVINKVALISAANSDGKRDFEQEIKKNKYGFEIGIDSFDVPVQGDTAAVKIIEALQKIANSKIKYDIIAIVRGGGSQTDFKPFDNYELAVLIAGYKLPIVTGIGHDRNTSIADLMARQLKTPTKVAAFIIDINFSYSYKLSMLYTRLQTTLNKRYNNNIDKIGRLKLKLPKIVGSFVSDKKQELLQYQRLLKSLSIDEILKKGFVYIKQQDAIVTHLNNDAINNEIEIITYKQQITAKIIKIKNDGK
jgi:exodeoxyribonuclease VII large subunit